MKTTLLLSVSLGLLLAGCTRDTSTKSTATTADIKSDNPAAPAAATPAAPADTRKEATPPASSVATTTAATPAPTLAGSPAAAAEQPSSPSPTVKFTPPPIVTPSEPAALAETGTPTAPTDVMPSAAVTADSPASATALSLDARITEWKLSGSDIAEELQKSDRIERSKTPGAGAPTGPMASGPVTEMISGKFQANADIAPQKFGIMVADDTATLTGTAQNPDQIGKAIALALDTDGIAKVVSRIKLESAVH